ncbi:MarR family winged helix-turn-helix transcriptional regulator [Secundilactobacillus collinoides]|uniref:HTH marR-type domain-containing protein n=1 Tax=Secundilactobacillus collinoides DSM 20515 = JCM 1123 TaxID=1423733 RepID=A0A0R2BCW3_SECCO|nr:MarR family transcriptional regulator [Secundilactobacillus collinoides]KRM77102.1 hypothetical protein FC82_GL000333 [Secundilactobacillus collinoides DSM 20515 = JCM 1123]
MEWHFFDKYIAGIDRMSRNDLKRALTEFDVNASQSDLLMNVFENPAEQQKDIAFSMGYDPSLLARDLKVMEHRGWITQRPDPYDKRAKVIAITPEGTKVATQIKTIKDNWWQHFFENDMTADPELMIQDLKQMYLAMQRKKLADQREERRARKN